MSDITSLSYDDNLYGFNLAQTPLAPILSLITDVVAPTMTTAGIILITLYQLQQG